MKNKNTNQHEFPIIVPATVKKVNLPIEKEVRYFIFAYRFQYGWSVRGDTGGYSDYQKAMEEAVSIAKCWTNIRIVKIILE